MGTAVAITEVVGSGAIQAGQATAYTVIKTGAEAVTQAVKLAGATSSAAIQAGQAVVEIATKTGSEAIALAMSQILQECAVPAFLLATGSGQQNFKCTFRAGNASRTGVGQETEYLAVVQKADVAFGS